MRGSLSVAFGLALFMMPGIARAADNTVDKSAGRKIVLHGIAPGHAGCSACHHVNGAGQPSVGIPRLAGLSAAYITTQLGYFASGKRQNPVMEPFAKELTPAQRKAVAAYFASLPIPPKQVIIAPSKALLQRGKTIFEKGNSKMGLAACAMCHGLQGQGMAAFPRIGGQSRDYILQQLTLWHSGAQRDPGDQAMRQEAHNLSPSDIQAVAAYVHSLPTKKESAK